MKRRKRTFLILLSICILIGGFLIFKESGIGRRLLGGEALTLVNRDYKMNDNFNLDDLKVPNVRFSKRCSDEEKKLKLESAEALEALFADANNAGVTLYANSGFRSSESQKSIIQENLNKKGKKYTDEFVAKVGHSEHQTGLAMDITNASRNFHKNCDEAKWLRENAYKYGFIIRYPEGKEKITGYNYEPWHIRYVGKSAAKKIHSK
ncbi:M15 family metallopeptidase, partial [Clostridium sp.]|uniref:M15 family metallopeptidase n=1 Tax=Clostridium sp. TaxID=1506 RepID=UPI002FC6C74F